MQLTTLRAAAIAGAALGLASTRLVAQSAPEGLEVHGSLNAAYGRSSDLPVFGIPTDGTADYRIATLQLRYKFAERDQFVVQLLNRRLGTSPLRNAIGDVSAQWAFWQHRDGNLTFKAGRAPLPRGLLNEVRYIGTVLPFYRVSAEFTGDAFDAVDGAVVSYRQPLGNHWSLEAHAFGGGTENRSVRATATELTVRVSRANNMVGGQLYLDGPFGTRLGAFASNYDRVADGVRGTRNFVAYSGQVDRNRWLARSEWVRESGRNPGSDIKSWYGQGVLKATERLHLAAEYTGQTQRIFPSNPALNVDVRSVSSTGAAINVRTTASTVVKFEHHWRDGYTYDEFVPPTTQTGSTIRVNPSRRTNYWLLSTAVSF